MIAVLTPPALTPKASPRLYVGPPLRWRHDPQRHLPQIATFAHDRGPIAGAESITAKPYRVTDQLTVSQVRQRSDKWRVNQPTSEVRREPSIFVLNKCKPRRARRARSDMKDSCRRSAPAFQRAKFHSGSVVGCRRTWCLKVPDRGRIGHGALIELAVILDATHS
jgi:hypothetical protein